MLKLASVTQQGIFESTIKPQLLKFLKSRLQDCQIHIVLDFEQVQEEEAKPQTPQDKYDFLLKQNPYLDTMKNEFDLEIELS